MTDLYMPTAADPPYTGPIYTSFVDEARPITPELLAKVVSKPATVTVEPPREDGYPEAYHVHFDQDLTNDERVLVMLTMQGGDAMDTLLARAFKALGDNQTWVANTLPQIVNGANAIINSTTASSLPNDKQLATAVRTLANQVADINNQNIALIKWVLDLRDSV